MSNHGTFIWNELCTTDPETSKAFYGALLGWSSRSVDMPQGGSYTIWQNGDRDVGGMLKMEGPQWDGNPPHWMSYVAVEDVDAVVARVESNGGQVRVPPFDVDGVGRICVIADPNGAVLSLMTPAEQPEA